MQVTLFPTSVCQKIDSVLRQFLWKGKVGERCLNYVKWSKVVTPRKYGGLGIRDTQCVNFALLGKLVWQLLHNNNKLWVRIMLAKYLSGRSCFSPNFSNNVSSTWRAIYKTIEKLRDGFDWCTGRMSQSFWYHAWRPCGTLAPLVPFVHISDSHLKLEDVWYHGHWRWDILCTMIPEEVKLDLMLFDPIKQAGDKTGWFWTNSNTLTYSTKSGYEWLLKKKFGWNDNENWLWLWRLRIPEKIKCLLWLCLNNGVPTASYRFQRGISTSDFCQRCYLALEDINHCFRTCQKARQIWISLNLGMTAEDSSLDFVSWIRSNLNKNEFLFAAAFWWIWRDRNNDIFHQDDPWSKEKIVHLVKHAARDFSNVVINQKHIIPSSLKYNWEPPPMNVCKVNCDASVFENEQLAGFGCIIRDSMGIWIKGCSASIPLSSVLCCELHAIWRGLVMAWDCECKEVICETDNLDAFLLVSRGTTSMIRNDSDLLDKIKEMLQRNWTATLVLIQRTANRAADLMAKTAALNKQVYLEWLQPPNNLDIIIREECYSFS